MLKAIVFVVGLVAAAAAVEDHGIHEQHIQLGSVGSYSAHLAGMMVPLKGASADGVPTYRFTSVVKGGAPVEETEYYKCRCNVVDNYYVPLGARAMSPVLLCRSVSFEKGSAPLTEADKMAFLLYSDKLTPDVRKINLLLGKSAYRNFLASHANPRDLLSGDEPRVEGTSAYDGYEVIRGGPAPFHSILDWNNAGHGARQLEGTRAYDGYEVLRGGPAPFHSILDWKNAGHGARQVYGYGITSSSPTGFTSVGVSGYPAVSGGSTVIWSTNPAVPAPSGFSPPGDVATGDKAPAGVAGGPIPEI